MMRAALARNAGRAVQLMTDHIGRTNERVAKTLGDGGRATDQTAACERQSVT